MSASQALEDAGSGQACGRLVVTVELGCQKQLFYVLCGSPTAGKAQTIPVEKFSYLIIDGDVTLPYDWIQGPIQLVPDYAFTDTAADGILKVSSTCTEMHLIAMLCWGSGPRSAVVARRAATVVTAENVVLLQALMLLLLNAVRALVFTCQQQCMAACTAFDSTRPTTLRANTVCMNCAGLCAPS